MSHNGVSRCGIFIAANVLIDQMEMDHEVDVFHAVKLIRLNRPQLIDGPRTRFTGDAKDEYKYLYDLMLHWYMTNPELRSFEPPEADSLGSDEGSSDESIGEAQSLGTNRRSVRSGNRRRRSIQRSKSSRASRRTTTTANSLIHGGTEITQKNSIETSNEQKKRMEPVYLN
uniref:Tyrosine-protein phosphatase domain-containing protein n=1 Tax=Meloidogyne hapla TaxID=6305 RepID=A0A1I8BRD3_MELHA